MSLQTNITKIKLVLVLLASAHIAMAQTVSLSSGAAYTSAGEKNNLIGNGHNIQADIFLPFYKKNWGGNSLRLGAIIGGNLTRLKNLHANNSLVADHYKVYNTTVTVDSRTGRAMSDGFSGVLGVQAQFQFGKMIISPAVNSGYMHFSPGNSVQTGSANINGQQQQVDLEKQESGKVKGILLKPELRVGYQLTPVISVFAKAAIVRGPEVRHTTCYLVPQGGFNDNNTYEPSQLANGTWASEVSTSNYNIKEFNLGVSVTLGRKKAQASRKGSGAASASYAATGRMSNPDPGQPAAKSINEKGVRRSEAMAKPGSPIGGIVVKGGKNPGGNNIQATSNEHGEVELHDLEEGTYTFRLIATEQSAGKSINEKGVKRSEAMARPGSPIGGIVVKGGKNPGGNSLQLISNENGEIELTVNEAGSYRLVLYNNESTPGQQNRKEKKKEKGGATPGLKDVLKTNV